MKTLIFCAVIAGGIFYSAAFGSKLLQAHTACEGYGYHDATVKFPLRAYCVVIMDGRRVPIRLEDASDKRPGEIDG